MIRIAYAALFGLLGLLVLNGPSPAMTPQPKLPPWQKDLRAKYVEKKNSVKQDDPDALYEFGVWCRQQVAHSGMGKIFRGQPEAIGLDAKFFGLSRGKLQGELHVRTVARRMSTNKA